MVVRVWSSTRSWKIVRILTNLYLHCSKSWPKTRLSTIFELWHYYPKGCIHIHIYMLLYEYNEYVHGANNGKNRNPFYYYFLLLLYQNIQNKYINLLPICTFHLLNRITTFYLTMRTGFCLLWITKKKFLSNLIGTFWFDEWVVTC